MANKFLTNLDLNLNELQNAKIQSLASDPSSGLVAGRLWYRSDTGKLNYYNGSEIRELGSISTGTGEAQGTVTSVALSLPEIFSVTGSPVTTNGTLSASLVNQSANTVFAAPNGAAGAPAFRKLVAADIPVLALSKIDGISATVDEINYLSGVKSNIQEQLDTVAEAAEGAFKSIDLAGVSYTPTDGVVALTAQNLIDAIGTTPVARATADADGNVISSTYIKATEKGQANGVATLDASGLVPTAQLPSYVDDIVEAYTVGTALSAGWLSASEGGAALTPETGKIYIVLSAGEYQNKQYRWSGSTYVLCNPSDVNSVNGKTGVVVLTQDDVNDGTSYVRMTPAERAKLANIAEGATNNVGTVTSVKVAGGDGISVENDTVTTAGTITVKNTGVLSVNGETGALVLPKKYTATNTALESIGGVWTWNITAGTHKINNNAMTVQVYEVASGALVFPEIAIEQSTYQVTIEMNDNLNASTLAADTYRAVIIG